MRKILTGKDPLDILFDKNKYDVKNPDDSITRLNRYLNSYIIESLKLNEKIEYNAQKKLVQCLKKGMIDEAIKIKHDFNINNEYIRSKFIIDMVKKSIIKCLNELKLDDIIKIKNNFYVPNGFIKSDEVQYKAKKKIIYCLKNGYIDDIDRIIRNFDIDKKFIESYEVKLIAQSCIIKFLKKYQIDIAIQIQRLFNIQDSNINNAMNDVSLYFASMGFNDLAMAVREKFLKNI